MPYGMLQTTKSQITHLIYDILLSANIDFKQSPLVIQKE